MKIEEAEQRRYLLSNPEKVSFAMQAASDLLEQCRNYAAEAAVGSFVLLNRKARSKEILKWRS